MTKIHNQEQLIQAAEKVFLEKGYAAARIEDIGNELGVLQGSLYYHVGSKAGLLRLVLRHRFLQMAERIDEISAGPGTARERMLAAATEQLKYHSPQLPDLPQWFNSARGPKATAKEIKADEKMVQRFRTALEDIFRDGIAKGEVRPDVEPETATLAVLGMCNFVARWYGDAHHLSAEEIAADQVSLLWAGVAV
ncbi:TetR/AcrR family transcriptional regulator [Nocardioides sp. QY071]|uniref:TetR/AcrR family transcriptional regulator n=1 Tax=Nocardioides sp. QY071 TaxID=3044187 RepID=UPI00249C059A|nr:TetR/AcrR family transcriptional regulator [Nocardioides sp. QY071]WGY00359.1 TetR/AcrR family transcriptional regulator [Nocardioides sp. QY071]